MARATQNTQAAPAKRTARSTAKRVPKDLKRPRARAQSASKPALALYHGKRDFSRTREPSGEQPAKSSPHRLSFVVQKHAASHLHYDFRLELAGVLLSWAVPKGPSMDPSVKRLAMETEPHPLAYGGFEGTIPKGEYGGGAVLVWDRGRWLPEADPQEAYRKGRLTFQLEGEKLKGTFHLVRSARGMGGKEGRGWLLFKSRDEHARADGSAIVDQLPNSALSGRSIEQVALDAGEPVPKSARQKGRSPRRAESPNALGAMLEALPLAKAAALPRFVEPELATLVDKSPEGDSYLHEIKLDGYRILARVEHGEVTLRTRNDKDWTARLPALASSLAALPIESALLDGEYVALNADGLSDFQLLQNSLSAEQHAALVYYVFDVLHLNGHDLRELPLVERKALLAQVVPAGSSGGVRLSEHVRGAGPEFFRKACELHLEGIVSKRANAAYVSGRTRDWLKIKCSQRQEFVIVGYSDPAGSRSHFGALLLGVEREGKLSYAGRVGTGFTQASLAELGQQLGPLARKTPPVADAPRGAAVRDVHWVEPELVAEIAFTGFTEDGVLRHPSFQGLREDKARVEVKLERPAPAQSYPLTHPDKVLYPELGITKRELLEYYELVAERMLPHVKNRPLTLVRCPNGWKAHCFFQKHPAETPPGLRKIDIREREGKAPYAVLDDARGLFALVQLGVLELHTWGSHADDFEHPDLLVFDLDPAPDVEFKAVIECALELRAIFSSAHLESFVKTTGGKGLHVCIPIEPDLDWQQVKVFCEQLALVMVKKSPAKYVATQTKAKRAGKIFIDYMRNGRGATFIAPYSTRARENAPVAVPLDWEELEGSNELPVFTLRTLEQRLRSQRVDPFARLPDVHQRLRPLTTKAPK